ncbi:M15 family metallopeptidase [Breznakiellaceae bacterium SP9]
MNIPSAPLPVETKPEPQAPKQAGALSPALKASLAKCLSDARIPPELAGAIQTQVETGAGFMQELNAILAGADPFLWKLVDKQNPLQPQDYEPSDLVPLRSGKSYTISRQDLRLREAAEAALEEMAAAARLEGITLMVSSSYRSYDYQVTVYNRNVRQLGQDLADRESSRPGFSQHQTGLAVDFGSIDDSFAATRAGIWVKANASRFGWIISFPQGSDPATGIAYEAITGYRWESWHYRYMGKPLAAFINDYFDGIQQYALQFIHEWEKRGKA